MPTAMLLAFISWLLFAGSVIGEEVSIIDLGKNEYEIIREVGKAPG
jgi:hypothetical protein